MFNLFRAIRRSTDAESPRRVRDLLRLAQAEPRNAQVLGAVAYGVWLEGEAELALGLGKQALELGEDAFPVLLVLTATHADRGVDAQTYEYAKRLASAPRADKAASGFAKLVAGTGLLSTLDRRSEQARLDDIARTYDDWALWAQQFVAAHEARLAQA